MAKAKKQFKRVKSTGGKGMQTKATPTKRDPFRSAKVKGGKRG